MSNMDKSEPMRGHPLSDEEVTTVALRRCAVHIMECQDCQGDPLCDVCKLRSSTASSIKRIRQLIKEET